MVSLGLLDEIKFKQVNLCSFYLVSGYGSQFISKLVLSVLSFLEKIGILN